MMQAKRKNVLATIVIIAGFDKHIRYVSCELSHAIHNA